MVEYDEIFLDKFIDAAPGGLWVYAMSHRSLFWPLALIVIAVATLALILSGTPGDSRAASVSAVECTNPDDVVAYPNCLKTQTADAKTATAQAGIPTTDPQRIIEGCPTNGPAFDEPYPPYGDCLKTRTALLLQTGQGSYTATSTSPPGSNSSNATATPTSTSTRTITPTLTGAATQPPLATAAISPTSQGAASSATATLPLGEGESAATPCIPGETILIEGSAGPSVALIVTFGGRPVGGGFSRDDGSYRIRMRIGDERPGIYPITVEDRDTSALIQKFSCEVPAFTPTPTPPHP